MNIQEIFKDKQKACITRGILEALPEWFEIPEGREKYIKDSCGKKLFERARYIAQKEGFSFIQVKTVKMGVYEDYDKTNLFYLSLGFKELEVFPELWDEANPCQIYIMSI